jgi:hypothetical protein
MPTRIVTYGHRPKRPPRKRKAIALQVPAIVTKATRRQPADPPPVADEPEPTPPPAKDDTPAVPAPPAAKSAIVTAKRRGRLAKSLRELLPDDPEVDARVNAFFARMIRPP